MKNKAALIIISLLICVASRAQDIDITASNIPFYLLKNAHAVVRYYMAEYQINGPDDYVLYTKIAVTVLDEKGKEHGNFSDHYKKGDTKIERIDGALFDKNGVKLKSVKKKDLRDMAAFGSSFVDDYRVITHSFEYNEYPYTTEYTEEIHYNSTLNLSSWEPFPGTKVSVEKATLRVEYPASLPIRYRIIHLPGQPTVIKEGDKNILTMVVTALNARDDLDGLTPVAEEQEPSLIMATDTFSLIGYAGSMATWKDMGRFFYQLNNGRDELTPEVKRIVHQLADTCKTDAGKIAVLYRYLQKNTRYVSIQLGIGGWQTFDATFVSEKKYGDCKALSNFMKAMLKEAGITGYLTLAYASQAQPPLLEDNFPCNRFNHVILCVPGRGDTTWLECTAQDLPAGYLSDFTSARKVLVNTPEGGALVSTPTYGKETNIETRNAELSLNDKDELTGNIKNEYKGSFWVNERHFVADEAQSDIDKHLNNMLGFSNYQVASSNIDNHNMYGIPYLTETVQVTATAEATRSGNNLILSTSVFPLRHNTISRPDTSTSQFELQSAYCIFDTVTIHLNGNYRLEDHTKPVIIDYPFGNYHVTYTLISKNTLVKSSAFYINAGTYAADHFKNYKRLRNESFAESKAKVVLVRE